jgi:hypothetical protein
MKSDKNRQSTEKKEQKLKPSNHKDISPKNEEGSNEEERSGIIPEDMDFKKFMGCGG